MHALRSFMFNNVYTNPIAKGEEVKAQNMLEGLFSYYMEHPEELSDEFKAMLGQWSGSTGDRGVRLHIRHDRPVRDL